MADFNFTSYTKEQRKAMVDILRYLVKERAQEAKEIEEITGGYLSSYDLLLLACKSYICQMEESRC